MHFYRCCQANVWKDIFPGYPAIPCEVFLAKGGTGLFSCFARCHFEYKIVLYYLLTFFNIAGGQGRSISRLKEIFRKQRTDENKDKRDQAFRNHQLQEDVLKDPGCCDITCNVDFSLLRNACKGRVQTFGPITQERFLKNMGIDTRFQVLLQNASVDQTKNLKSAYHYLTDPENMGEKFKVFAFINKGRPTPAAF